MQEVSFTKGHIIVRGKLVTRICNISSHSAWRSAGVMNLVQMSRSLRLRLSISVLRIAQPPIGHARMVGTHSLAPG
jgi:hypothetical protein